MKKSHMIPIKVHITLITDSKNSETDGIWTKNSKA
jgi:hypothetical protein